MLLRGSDFISCFANTSLNLHIFISVSSSWNASVSFHACFRPARDCDGPCFHSHASEPAFDRSGWCQQTVTSFPVTHVSSFRFQFGLTSRGETLPRLQRRWWVIYKQYPGTARPQPAAQVCEAGLQFLSGSNSRTESPRFGRLRQSGGFGLGPDPPLH